MTTFNRHELELATAAAVGIFAGVIVFGSLQLDTGWSATGPQSGYFPLRLGILLALVSLGLFLQALRSPSGALFATGEQLRRSFAVFAPTVLLVIAMPLAGCYASAAVYLVYMARVHGGFGWTRSLALGLGAMLVFFAVFELWFKVQLPKGPLEAWLGYH